MPPGPFDAAESFSEGLAGFGVGDTLPKRHWSFIDKTGKSIIEPQFFHSFEEKFSPHPRTTPRGTVETLYRREHRATRFGPDGCQLLDSHSSARQLRTDSTADQPVTEEAMRQLFLGAGLVVALSVSAPFMSPASAGLVVPGSGFSGLAGQASGSSAYGDPWSWQLTLGGITAGVDAGWSSWGSPGLGIGSDLFGGPIPVSDFHITFELPDDMSIVQIASADPGGYEETTRFSSCAAGCTAWNVSYSSVGNLHTVDFVAPAGTYLNPNDPYFVNVVFNGRMDPAAFSAHFTVVPEPGALALLGAALLGLSLTRRRHGRS